MFDKYVLVLFITIVVYLMFAFFNNIKNRWWYMNCEIKHCKGCPDCKPLSDEQVESLLEAIKVCVEPLSKEKGE